MNFNKETSNLTDDARVIYSFYKMLHDKNLKFDNNFKITMDRQLGSISEEPKIIKKVKESFENLKINGIISSFEISFNRDNNEYVITFSC